MAEGLNKAIELKGIARNTAPSTCQDGELEEIINLRFKDGSWKPVGELENMGSVGQHTELYVHTNLYHHLLGVKSGALYWFANIEDGKVVNLDTPIEIAKVTGEVSIKQTGHLITIIDSEGLTYSLFNTQKDEYITINADFNGKQTDTSLIPEGLVDFRVTAVVDEFNRPLYAGISEPMNFDYITNQDSFNQDNINKIGRQMESVVDKLYSMANESKYFAEGYMMLCYAIELYDGSYILQSRPILCAPPYVIKEESKKYNVGVVAQKGDGTKYIKHNPNVCDEAFRSYYTPNLSDVGTNIEFDEESSVSIDILSCINNFGLSGGSPSGVDFEGALPIHKSKDARDEVKAFPTAKYVDIYSIKNASSLNNAIYACNVKPFRPLILNVVINSGDFDTSEVGIAYTAFNKLQVKFNNQISTTYKDLFKGISVFITDPVRPFAFDFSSDFKICGTTQGQGASNYDPFGTYDIYPVYKKKEDIIEELKNKTSFYKIKDIKLDDIKLSEWVDVEIEEGLLSVLTEQERLTIDNFSRNSYVPKTTFSYNGRLHLANYTSDMFRGFPLNYFFGHNAEGQWNVKMGSVASEGLPYSTYIAVEIETSEGISKVVRYTPANNQGKDMIYDLNPIISYPDSRAKKITIVVNDGVNETAWKSEFELTPHPYFNFAYYIDPNLKPINLFQYDGSQSLLPTEVATQENKNNCVKVSSVDNPFYFPVANTYQIGNSEIIGFATNTIALSTGQAGDAPLYVFTKDGIYALFVDASGQLTYTNSRPIARDICNNPKSITPIDDGVLFTTDRGLMLLSGSEVIDMSDIAEGVPFDLSSVPEIDACVNHPQLVQLKSNTSKENFLEYIKGAVIGYNYFDKEIWISNPTKTYSYVYNIRVKGWTKRTESAKELVGDYPYVYMLDENKDLRTISKEIVGLTETMFLTRPIKLQTQEFKQGYRTILRSLLDIDLKQFDWKVIYPATDAEPLPIGDGDYIELISPQGRRYRFVYRGGEILYSTLLDNVEKGEYLIIPQSCYCGIYLFGSYDCRKWALIGARERDGVIRDLGLLSHRVDCKYFRLLFVGKLKEGSTIEYVEMSAEARLLADKIR